MERRETRLKELRELKRTNPLRLIALFTQVTGVEVVGELPYGYGFERIIRDILEHEERRRISDNPR